MKDESSAPKANGQDKANGDVAEKPAPAKKGRVGALVDAEKKAVRRRSSLGVPMSLQIPQVPGRFNTPCGLAEMFH
jgi:hypothetical protein